ncbi:hypothetical protein [Chitinophaga sancti]|uniref:Uncharacterized protein n=1 Tax=Chitinophaga sancti TaxID=1004 RepID=A0A1K1S6G3_9BACT|nr:hypothetical protein [Chitinophaga sancti]WQD62232.1 hypothetical protein U0033_30540 [Chitinophaga sancti]WQG92199.1 hypothetical protein SR876_11845 [Chitinophaga sancti]SFW79802.1 hypothetical protein SAMN05661012_04837 [Chitinophaga sancti]
MNKLKLAFAALAALVGVGAAYAMKAKPDVRAENHYWVTVNGTTVLFGTTANAELNCPGTGLFCLRATDNPNLIVSKAN